MSERDIGQEILEGIQDIKEHKAGKKALRTHTITEPPPPQEIRARLELSQAAFAGLMGMSLRMQIKNQKYFRIFRKEKGLE